MISMSAMQKKLAKNSLNLLKLRNGKGMYSSFLNSFNKKKNDINNYHDEMNTNFSDYNRKDKQIKKELKSLLNNDRNEKKFDNKNYYDKLDKSFITGDFSLI